jgi:hypothetical protein
MAANDSQSDRPRRLHTGLFVLTMASGTTCEGSSRKQGRRERGSTKTPDRYLILTARHHARDSTSSLRPNAFSTNLIRALITHIIGQSILPAETNLQAT